MAAEAKAEAERARVRRAFNRARISAPSVYLYDLDRMIYEYSLVNARPHVLWVLCGCGGVPLSVS